MYREYNHWQRKSIFNNMNEGRNNKTITVCPKCGKVDVDKKHIKNCNDNMEDRLMNDEHNWK